MIKNIKYQILRKNLYYNELPVSFSDEMLVEINEILGKKYVSAKLVHHRFFEREGDSILFETPNLNYSEAFAGSGEMAATILVYKVMTAKPNSLILLDEPEVSLHPKAQERLRDFLINQSLSKKLQIVVSTHSPSFVNELPNEAIKVFREGSDGMFEILQDVSYLSAFNIVGFSLYSQKTVITEDNLSTLIIKAVIGKYKNEIPELVDLNVINNFGGAENLYKDAANILRYDEKFSNKHFFLLDGDKFVKSFDNIDYWVVSAITKENLDKHIKEVINIDSKKLFVHDSTPDDKDLIEQRREFIRYCDKHVGFLPENIPEEIIWNDECCKKMLDIWNKLDEALLQEIDNLAFKDKFSKLAEVKYGDSKSENTLNIQKDFILNWLGSDSENVENIKNILLEVMNS